ncbi:GGDEF domain-containing protein (plasmid) [Streptomyces sp. NBC_01527]|uniref:diguanylate cyclase domain-containing protein n=1 Tax=unclassified Streptomyces TaxID=2593676 RepID=UPI002E133EFE|nr:GGDEF domain-containing protein [Streptomyces sp. NBC_01230]
MIQTRGPSRRPRPVTRPFRAPCPAHHRPARRLVQAHHDPFTRTWRREGSPTAQRLLDHHCDEVVLVLADADHFKQRNDRHGHATGDIALTAIGGRLTGWAGRHDVAGRLGGDEFTALTRIETRHKGSPGAPDPPHDLPGPPQRRLVAAGRLLGAATRDSIGSTDLPTLMRAADAAIYRQAPGHLGETRFVSDAQPKRRRDDDHA